MKRYVSVARNAAGATAVTVSLVDGELSARWTVKTYVGQVGKATKEAAQGPPGGPRNVGVWLMDLNKKEVGVLRALRTEGPMIMDRYVTSRDLYVASYSGVFTNLRKAGLIARTGAEDITSHGKPAKVVRITQAGIEALEWIDALEALKAEQAPADA